MGDIFCLIILENGIRRKLKLQSGTYDELLAGLAGMVEVDSKNTLVQIFDTDLDDLVDLLPGDLVPNRAKIHVLQRTASASCSTGGDAVLCSSPPQSTPQIVSASSMAISELVKQEIEQPNVLPFSASSLGASMDTSGGEASLDAPDSGDRTNIDYSTEASEQMTEDEPEEVETSATVVAKEEPGESNNGIISQNGPCIFGKVLSPSAAAKIQDIIDAASLSSTLRDEEDSVEASVQQELAGEPEPIQDVESATSIEQRVIRFLLEIRQQQRECLHQLKQLRDGLLLVLEKTGAQAPTPPAVASVELPTLPAHTIDELNAAEAAVGDRNVAAALRKHLVHIGGRSLREVGRNVMTAIMGVTVQQQFSLHGRKGKRPFVSMRLCKVATDAICEKQGVDMSEAQGFIRTWLPGSVDRAGGRKRRYTESF